jgi:hypothetical protein
MNLVGDIVGRLIERRILGERDFESIDEFERGLVRISED